MTAPRRPAARVALVDLRLADCDELARRLGVRLEVRLVVAPDVDSPLARWAELGGYPWATDLEALTAVVADAVAIGENSPRRGDAVALAGALGARSTVFGAAETAAQPATDPVRQLDDVLAGLFAEPSPEATESALWRSALDAGFVAGALAGGNATRSPEEVGARFGSADALVWLLPLLRQARQAARGWAQLALSEGGLWRAWCALAPEGERGPALALGGRLLPASGYGAPSGKGPEAARDRRLCQAILGEWGLRRPA